jgi:hypothetical protein
VTAYLYGSLDSGIYMKVLDGISVPNVNIGCNMYCVKLNKLLYDLKWSGRMWYNQMKEFLINKGYYNNDDCPYVFIRKPSTGFCIISIFVDDLNIIGSPTIIYEDNATCIAQMQSGYMKSNATKHITSKLFYSHKLQVNGEINILKTKSCDNLVIYSISLCHTAYLLVLVCVNLEIYII